MKILFDARKIGDGGIGIYIENLLDGFCEIEDGEGRKMELSLLVSPDCGKPEHDVAKRLRRFRGRFPFIVDKAGKYSLDEYLAMGFRLRKNLAVHDVFHSPHYTLPFLLPIPRVVTVHDLIHVDRPERITHSVFAKRLIRSAISRADCVITVSRYSRERVMSSFPDLETPIVHVPNSLHRTIGERPGAAMERFCKSRNLEPGYLLFVGSDRPHKGFSALLRAVAALRSWGSPSVGTLTLVALGARFSDDTRREALRLGLGEVVRFEGGVEQEEMSFYYGAAGALVIASRDEGFGLPALEAMACGTPVIATPLPAVSEICGASLWKAEDFTAAALAEAIELAWRSEEERAKRVKTGRHLARSYSSSETARMTLRVYESVVENGGHLDRVPVIPRRCGAAAKRGVTSSDRFGIH